MKTNIELIKKQLTIAESTAIEMYEGDREKAIEWLTAPNYALAGTSPFVAIIEGQGNKVMMLLVQINEGGVI